MGYIDRTLSELRDFVKSMKEEKGKKKAGDEADKVPEEDKAASGPVVFLNKDTFTKQIKSGVTFVKFFAPWCGHCKRLAPTWEDLAKAFDADDDVTVAKVDCTSDDNVNKDLCNDQGVSIPRVHFPILSEW